jgi:dipeptidyl aminopeptidase/acylaminoacyl peptidase
MKISNTPKPLAIAKLSTLSLLLGFGLATADVDNERFPVEDVLSASFPQEIRSAPVGERVAFVLNDHGKRNIWLADGPYGGSTYAARQLTHYEEDDGVQVSGLMFSSDGKQLVFVRGEPPNRAGEFANPASLPNGTELAIYVVDIAPGTVRKIDDGSEPAIHPGGESIAYIKDGSIWQARLGEPDPEQSDNDWPEPVQLLSARGGLGNLLWSVDGRRLLFVSNRGSHSFVGVWSRQSNTQSSAAEDDSTSGAITWLAPSFDRDISPVWSADSSKVAFIRLPTRDLDQFIFEPIREDLPWSVWIADVASGQARVVWQADPGAGSAWRNIVADSQLFWGRDRLVFAWEKTGWTHLWSIPDSVSRAPYEARELTPGKFEVEHVSMTADRRSLVYSSNQEDLHRRHLWQVGVAGGQPKLLTPGKGLEWSPSPQPEGGVAYIRSDALRPASVALLDKSGRSHDLAPTSIPVDFPDNLVVPQPVTVAATDGMTAYGQLFLPGDIKQGERRPAVIFLHGGSRRQMLLGWHKSFYYHNAYGMSQYLASRGIIALALNYRSGIGYGLNFREAEEYGATGASELRDVLGAGLYLRGRKDVLPDKIAVWGGSYGGYLTAHALAQASDIFVAGVDFHGVHDWNQSIRNFVPYYNPNDYPQSGRIADESSPLHFIDDWRSPVLLIHGDDDRNVNFTQSTRLIRALRSRDVTVEQLVFPDEVHGFMLHRNWESAYRASADFLVKYLE